MRSHVRLLLAVATLAYPLVVYLGFGRWHPAWIAAGLVTLLVLRAWSGRDAMWLVAGLGAALLGVAASVGDSWLPMKLYPVAVSLVMLGVFAFSLWRGPTVIERIARITEPSLPPEAVAYTRKVTVAWCGFFLVNGAISAATTLWASQATWLLYNGLLAYAFMGAFFGAEWLLRQRMRARLTAEGLHG